MNSSRSVSGTPTAAGMGTATVTVSDNDGDTDTLDFAWSVAADLMPTFGTSSVSDKSWKLNVAITAFTMPAATGGDGTLSYSATGLPAGVSMSASRQVRGTPIAFGSGTATVTATDDDGDTTSLLFNWTVTADLMPTFGTSSVDAQGWTANQAITAFTVPAATGGNTPLSYTASGLPAGIAMSTSRALSGTPTSVGTGTATVTATDADGDTATFTFNWAVVADDLTPSFGAATIASQSWITGKEITAFAAPAATGGNAPLVHGIGGLPAGVVMLNSMQIQGTPTAAGSGTATVAARDADGDLAKVSFNWTVTANAQPSFGTSTVSSQSWTAGQAITSLTVPSATGGNGTLSYGIAGLPEGVTLSPTLQLSGTPLATDSGTATVTARDTDGDTATLTFNWSVGSPDGSGSGTVLMIRSNPTTSASYKVKGNYTGTQRYSHFTLFETNPAGQVMSFRHNSVPFDQDIDHRPDGTYTYRLEGCYFKRYKNLRGAYKVCETVGDELSVTVDGPDPDSVGTQLADTYEARTGDLNDDGTIDALWIRRTSTATGGGLFQDVVLKSTPTGSGFSLVAPSSAGASTGTWPVTTGVDIVLNDINLDGFVDILVRGLGGAITGALDQIVYAPGRTGAALGTLRAVDSSLTNFLGEVSSWTQNPMFFQQHQKPGEVTVTVHRTNCFNAESRRFCSSIPTVVIEVSGARPTNKSSEARKIAQQFTVANGRINPDVTLGSQQARNLSGTLQSVFGTEILDGQLERACNGSFAYDSEISLPCSDAQRVGRIVLAQILTIEGLCIDRALPDCNGNGRTDIGEFRLLTPAERQLATANSLNIQNLEEVRVYRVSVNDPRLKGDPDRWFEQGGHIYVPTAYGNNRSFEEEFTSVIKKAVLLHELTHVWQHYNPHVVHVFVSDPMPEDYVYRTGDGSIMTHPNGETKRFEHFTNEQQAEIMHDRYIFSQETTAGVRSGNIDSDRTTNQMFDQLNVIPGIPGGSVP